MADREILAHDLVRQKDYTNAINEYDSILSPTTNNFKTPKDQIIGCLVGRTECYIELKNYEAAVIDCKRLLKMITSAELPADITSTTVRIRRRLIHALYKLKRFQEAETACRDWISCPQVNADMLKVLERYRTVIQMINGQKSNQRISIQRLDEEMATLDTKLETWATHNLPQDKFSRVTKQLPTNNHTSTKKGLTTNESKAKEKVDNQIHKNLDQVAKLAISNGDDNDVITCTYCAVNFLDRMDLRAHCQTESHQNVIMSDEGRDWKWRPPPRGYTADSYNLCESFNDNSVCHYGNQCVEAHGSEELNEWKERLVYRKMRLQRACEKELYGKSYTEQILERWISAPSPDKIMKEKIDGVDETCSNELVTTVSSKVSKRDWTFVFKTRRMLKAVALLQDAHRNHFTLKQVFPAEPRPTKRGQGSSNKVIEAELSSDQEWVVQNSDSRYAENPCETSPVLEHRVKVVFTTDIYGTFRQAVVFDFGSEPVLVKHLCVDVIPVTDVDKIQEIRKEMVLSTSKRWDNENSIIIPFETTLGPHLTTPEHLADEEREKDLLERYPCPRASTFTLTQTTITEKKLTKNNYRSRIHELLYVEEIARYEQVARYNLTTNLRITSNYLLTPSGMATSTAKYSHSGELFALMTLGKDVSEDTSAGRLILNNCTTVYLSNSVYTPASDDEKRHVFEAQIEDKGKTVIYLKLSAQCVAELKLAPDTEYSADIQFQLNRLSYCEWHHALDKIADFRIIFPETYLEPSIPWTPKKQWADMVDPKLNSKQKEAVLAITTASHMPLPPILLIGPFGTGKTYTLASSIKQLLLQDESRILICTHSNSAADLYIKDYLHPWVEEGCEEARPLRVYYHKRWVATVNSTVQKYCLIELAGNVRNFRRPSKEDIMKYRIVVVTLSISMELASLDLPKGYFTHIFLDEAAQAMECEAIMPLALAGDTTRIVLAGDHMQMSPELFSNFAKERKLHISLLERLYDHYPADFPCKILLCENYRAHEAITKFTSELFYDQKLIASGKQPKHDKFYPLTFFTTRGEDVQDKNSTAFYNNAEVYEVVERVCELKKKWPAAWGKINDQSIGIMTPYADQVFRIRSELRKRRMGGISVERVLNVQGKQFRAIFLSTVRTRRTCAGVGGGSQSDDMDYGFLSNSKLLNTAITRAQSLVAVVGDPLALCSIGRCRKVWERFIEICYQNKSLYGITWSLLRSQLDGVELKKTYVLNPLAPEFIPRAHQAEAYLRDQQSNLHMQQQQYQQHHQQQYHHHPQSQQFQLPIHHLSHTNFPPQNVLNPQIRAITNAPPMQQFATPNLNSQQQPTSQQFPYIFYQNQQQQQAQQHQHPPQPIRAREVISAPQISQQPQQQQQQQPHFPSSSQSNLWGPSSYPNVANPWPKPTSQPPLRPQQPTSSQQPLHLNLSQSRQQIASLRSPGSQNMHSQMSFMQNNKPPPPPPNYLVAQQQNHLRNMGDTISPGSGSSMMQGQIQSQDHISPLTNDMLASIAARANQVHQQNAYSAAITKNQPRPVDQQNMHMDKDLQFLQNVHIPDRLLHHPQAQMGGLSMPSPSPDFSSLLPPNMSFYEMALENKEVQFNWFVKLVETQGVEVANRFAEILRQVPTLASLNQNKLNLSRIDQALQPMPNVQGYGTHPDLTFDTLMSNASMSQPIIRLDSDLLGTKDLQQQQLQQQKQSQHLSQFQSNSKLHPMSLGSSNRNSVILNELGGYRINDVPQQHHQQPQQSVPLYRRQAGQNFGSTGSSSSNTQSVSSSTPDTMDNNIFDNLFNHHDNQFHGILPIQALSAALQPSSFHLNLNHNQSTQPQQQQQQQQLHRDGRDDMINRHNNSSTTTYASVLTQGTNQQNQNMSALAKQQQQQQQQQSSNNEEKDPFAAIRELGQRSNGYYNYFQ